MSVDKDHGYVQCGSTPFLALSKQPITGMACVLPKGHDGSHQDHKGRRRLS